MVSRLASQLIRLPHPEGAAADMLWRYATLTDVERTRTAVSEILTVELAQFLDGAAATSFARLLPSTRLTSIAFATNPSGPIREGLVVNPLCSDDVLVAISSKGVGSKAASERLTRRAAFNDSRTSGADITESLEALVATGDAAPFVELADVGPEALVGILAGMSDLSLRCIVLDALQVFDQDAVIHALIGAIDQSHCATVIDDRLAEWLCTSESMPAQASREVLLTDRDASASVMARLDHEARRRLAAHESLWAVVQRRVRLPNAANSGPAHPLDRGMLSSMRLAGMGVAEISALIFNSRIDLEPDELAQELNGIDAVRLAGYFTGSNARHPRPGEIDALVATLDPFEQHRLAEALTGDIDQYPWSGELLVGIPRRYQSIDDTSQLEVLDQLLQQELADDAKAWEVVLSMSEEWEGNLRSLVSAARQL